MPLAARRPIRILIANCPQLNDAACAYLLLAQNTAQKVFEFELYHLFVDAEHAKVHDGIARIMRTCAKLPIAFKSILSRRYRARIERILWPPLDNKVLPLNDWYDLLKPHIEKHEEWLGNLSADYGNWTMRPGPTIILTETALWGGYLSSVGPNFALVSLANWRSYAPPSVLEYALMSVQRAALRMAVNQQIGCHYPTRGCVWDFTAHQPDARLSVVGSLCDACQALVREQVGDEALTEIQFLVSHKWIGKTDEPGSVASNLKRVFGYDLAITQGLSPTFFDRLREAVPSALMKVIVGLLIAIGGFLFGLWWNSPVFPPK